MVCQRQHQSCCVGKGGEAERGIGEGINNLVTSRDMSNTQLRRLNQVTNKVIINRKVFHARMENRISREISDTKVAREQSRRGLHSDKKLRQQRLHPLQIDSSSGNGTILGLSGRLSNNKFLCSTPGDWISTKECEKITCGGTII